LKALKDLDTRKLPLDDALIERAVNLVSTAGLKFEKSNQKSIAILNVAKQLAQTGGDSEITIIGEDGAATKITPSSIPLPSALQPPTEPPKGIDPAINEDIKKNPPVALENINNAIKQTEANIVTAKASGFDTTTLENSLKALQRDANYAASLIEGTTPPTGAAKTSSKYKTHVDIPLNTEITAGDIPMPKGFTFNIGEVDSLIASKNSVLQAKNPKSKLITEQDINVETMVNGKPVIIIYRYNIKTKTLKRIK
jgi:hypothetical protein